MLIFVVNFPHMWKSSKCCLVQNVPIATPYFGNSKSSTLCSSSQCLHSMRRLLKGKRGDQYAFPISRSQKSLRSRRGFKKWNERSSYFGDSEAPNEAHKLLSQLLLQLAEGISAKNNTFFCIKCIIRCCLIDPIQQKVLHITVLPETNKVTQSDSEKCPLNFRLKCSLPAILGR